MLLVDDGQPQSGEDHVLLDHRVRAHHQHGLARRHLRHHSVARFAFAAARQPRNGQPQRRQPAHQFAKVLLGQDLGGCHQRALPASVDGARRGQRGHHCLARPDIALQQPVHGLRPRQVGGHLGHHALLGAGQLEWQGRQKLAVQAVVSRRQRGGCQRGAFGLGLGLRKLLGQQLVELQALPGRVAVVFQ